MVARRPWQGWSRRSWMVLAVVAVLVIGATAILASSLLGAFRSSPGPGPVAASPSAASPSPSAGGSASPNPSPSPLPSASPAPGGDGTLIGVREGAPLAGISVRFVNLDGAEMLAVKPSTPKGEVFFVGFHGSRALFRETVVHADTAGKTTYYEYVLKALHRDGTVETLTNLGTESYLGPHLGNWVFSPDGTQWLWTEWNFNDAEALMHSVLHLTSLGGGDRIIEVLDSATRIVVAYGWNEGGPLVVHELWGIGGNSPLGFGAMGDVYLLNTASGTLTLLWPESPCRLYARAADGTIACIEDKYTLKIGKPPNLDISIPLNRTRFAAAGGISFKPGPEATVLSIIGCAFSDPRGWYNCSTDLVDTRTGDIWRFGPDGLTASGWLPDGNLLAHNIPDMDNPDQTVYAYIVSQSGEAKKLTTGSPAGIWPG